MDRNGAGSSSSSTASSNKNDVSHRGDKDNENTNMGKSVHMINSHQGHSDAAAQGSHRADQHQGELKYSNGRRGQVRTTNRGRRNRSKDRDADNSRREGGMGQLAPISGNLPVINPTGGRRGHAGGSATVGGQTSSQQVYIGRDPGGLQMTTEEQGTVGVGSIKGLKPGNPNWINQDNFFVVEQFDNRSLSYYCVLDGHGEHGHHVSKRIREKFPEAIRGSSHDMKKSFAVIQSDMNQCDIDTRCSGATCTLVALENGTLTIYNCGDSRAVLGRRTANGSYVAVPLSHDHKPDRPDERKRILNCGGHLGCRQVLVSQGARGPVTMPVGPCRVWYQYRGDTLGLAMSRSLGDTIVHRSGVSAEPEITTHMVEDYDDFIVIATDGVWDVVDNNQAVQIVQSFAAKSPTRNWSALEAAVWVCKFARGRWEKLSPMVDDITCLVIKLHGNRNESNY